MNIAGISSKFLNMLQLLYTNTENAVWCDSEISDWFVSGCGVKQGCVISPILFSIFMNDLVEAVGGGVTIRNKKINMQLYADDITFFSTSPVTLQLMINRFKRYCDKWGLTVNNEKSEIMVMRKTENKLRNDECWFFGDKRIKVVDKYKYLGINLRSNLNLKPHLSERAVAARNKLNSVWSTFLNSNTFHYESKLDLINAVGRSTMCVGSQYWGFEKYEEIEGVNKSFIKRILNLPKNTPNYALRTELGIKEWFVYTLKCHMNYIHKVLFSYQEDRFPNFLATIFIDLKIDWFQKGIELGEKCNVDWTIMDKDIWRANINAVLKHWPNL